MSADSNVNRRSVLGLGLAGLVGFSLAGIDAVRAESAETKKELLGELKKLDYKEELFDVGPEKESELKIDEKRVTAPPEYVEDEKEILEKEEKDFATMLAKEEADAAKIRATFGKKK